MILYRNFCLHARERFAFAFKGKNSVLTSPRGLAHNPSGACPQPLGSLPTRGWEPAHEGLWASPFKDMSKGALYIMFSFPSSFSPVHLSFWHNKQT